MTSSSDHGRIILHFASGFPRWGERVNIHDVSLRRPASRNEWLSYRMGGVFRSHGQDYAVIGGPQGERINHHGENELVENPEEIIATHAQHVAWRACNAMHVPDVERPAVERWFAALASKRSDPRVWTYVERELPLYAALGSRTEIAAELGEYTPWMWACLVVAHQGQLHSWVGSSVDLVEAELYAELAR